MMKITIILALIAIYSTICHCEVSKVLHPDQERSYGGGGGWGITPWGEQWYAVMADDLTDNLGDVVKRRMLTHWYDYNYGGSTKAFRTDCTREGVAVTSLIFNDDIGYRINYATEACTIFKFSSSFSTWEPDWTDSADLLSFWSIKNGAVCSKWDTNFKDRVYYENTFGTPKRPMVLNFALSAYSGVAHNHYYAQFMRGKEFVPDSVFDVPSYCPDLAPGDAPGYNYDPTTVPDPTNPTDCLI